MSNSRTVSSTYTLDSDKQSSSNYINALDRCLQHAFIQKINGANSNSLKPFKWNDVKKLFGGDTLTIHCAFANNDSSIGILPTMSINHFMTYKNQDPQKNLIAQVKDITNYINVISQQNPHLLCAVPHLQINNKDEALFIVGHLLKQFKLSDVTGIVSFDQHQLILLQICHQNYYLNYGTTSKFQRLLPIKFDLDDGFWLETKNDSHALEQNIYLTKKNAPWDTSYQTYETKFNTYVDEYLNAIRDKTLRAHNLNIEYFFSYILTKMPQYKNIFPSAKTKPISSFLKEFEQKVYFNCLKDFITQGRITDCSIIINIDCENMENYYQQYSEYATELKILFELQTSFYQWQQNNYGNEMIPITELGIPYLQKPLFACQGTLFSMNFQTHELNNADANPEHKPTKLMGII